MIKSIVKLCALALVVLTADSCKLIRHKRGKKQKEKAAVETRRLDSLAAGIKQAAVTDSAMVNVRLLDSMKPVVAPRVNVTTFAAKAKMHYEGGDKSLDFVANIRMKQDSIIWISVSAGGGLIQVARAVITPDSFKAVSFLENTAYIGPISKASSILPEGVDFYSLQNMLLGNPVLSKGQLNSVADSGDRWELRQTQLSYIEQLDVLKSDSTVQRSQLVSNDSLNRSLTQQLHNFGLFGNLRIAQDRKFNIINKGEGLLVDMNLSNIVIDAEQKYPFSIPEGYTIR
ncbi:DUF4292 domain-containing protein [Rurimicrobium arvi]|uniref:DUF4292 domain-containing protein n=1 Tax=Rurimicrobium arvi TaxID=2049916 RepID=A0ABP8MSD8_9BACT